MAEPRFLLDMSGLSSVLGCGPVVDLTDHCRNGDWDEPYVDVHYGDDADDEAAG